MVGLIFVVAVMNVGIGYGLAVMVGQGPSVQHLGLPKFSLLRNGTKEPAGH